MKCRLLSLFVALSIGGQGLVANERYFPAGGLDDTAKSSEFREQWYSKHLAAMKEPSLLELSKNDKAESYRFLWLRTFNHPIVVRVDMNPDGTAVVVTKMTKGEGGYEPGKLILNRRRSLNKDQAEFFLDEVKKNGLWELPTFETDPTVVHLDGAQWIFESVKRGKYRVVDRWSPDTGPIRNIGILMAITLANLKLLYDEVY